MTYAAIQAIKMDIREYMHIYIWVVEEIKFISEIQLDLYRTICPSLVALVAAGLYGHCPLVKHCRMEVQY